MLIISYQFYYYHYYCCFYYYWCYYFYIITICLLLYKSLQHIHGPSISFPYLSKPFAMWDPWGPTARLKASARCPAASSRELRCFGRWEPHNGLICFKLREDPCTLIGYDIVKLYNRQRTPFYLHDIDDDIYDEEEDDDDDDGGDDDGGDDDDDL